MYKQDHDTSNNNKNAENMNSVIEENMFFSKRNVIKTESKTVQEVLSNSPNAYVHIICYRLQSQFLFYILGTTFFCNKITDSVDTGIFFPFLSKGQPKVKIISLYQQLPNRFPATITTYLCFHSLEVWRTFGVVSFD